MLIAGDVRAVVDSMLTTRTQKQLAGELGVSLSYLNDYLHFRREPGVKLLDGLGIQRIVMYEHVTPTATADGFECKSEELYERLASLSKSLEGSGRIDQYDCPDAYATLLETMNFLRALHKGNLTQEFANNYSSNYALVKN